MNKETDTKKKFPRTNNKGRKNYKDRKTERVSVKEDKANDPSWYTKVGQLTSDVATISFNNPVGVPITLSSESMGANTLKFSSVPGILSIYTTPAVSVAPHNNAGSTAINIAAQNLYSNIRYWNSGHSNYDPADLMVYLMSMDSIYSFYAYMARIYGVARIFAHTNRYVGDAMMTAMGVNPSSIRSTLADFRAYINSFVLKASTFATPNTMSIFQRHVWMYSSIFSDEDVQKSQYYMYVPAVLWKFATDPVEGYGMCALHSIAGAPNFTTGSITPRTGSSLLGFTNLRTIGDTLLDAIYSDEDAGIISGDIIKAYGMDKLWKLSEIAPEYATLPIFSEEVLTQIHNTRFSGSAFEPGLDNLSIPGLELRQDPSINKGMLLFEPVCLKNKMNLYDAILDTWHENPTADDVIVSSRNILHGQLVDGKIHLDSCGSEICISAGLWYYDVSMTLVMEHIYHLDTWWINSATAQQILTKFNEYPHFLWDDGAGNLVAVMGELSNYTILSGEEIRKMNESAILSLLAVPHFGTASK